MYFKRSNWYRRLQKQVLIYSLWKNQLLFSRFNLILTHFVGSEQRAQKNFRKRSKWSKKKKFEEKEELEL